MAASFFPDQEGAETGSSFLSPSNEHQTLQESEAVVHSTAQEIRRRLQESDLRHLGTHLDGQRHQTKQESEGLVRRFLHEKIGMGKEDVDSCFFVLGCLAFAVVTVAGLTFVDYIKCCIS